MTTEVKLAKLRRFNLLMAFLHLGQGIAMLLVSSSFSLPVMASFLKFDFATQKLVPSSRELFSLRIGPMVAGFLFLSSLAHFILTLPKVNEWYNKNLQHGINYARWIEYAFSSSLMIIVIAMLVGIYDAASLILIFFLNASMILFGWMMELHNQTTKKTDWTAFIFGCISGIATWLAIGLYLWNPGSDTKAPNFVYWIYFSIFLFFNCFAVNQYLQYKKIGKWADYLYGERAYIVLSLVAKSLLAWQVFAGTLRP